LFVAETLFCETVRSNLAHPNSMTPAATFEYKRGDAAVIVEFAVNYKKLLLQSERGPDATSTNVGCTTRPNYLKVCDTMRRATCDNP